MVRDFDSVAEFYTADDLRQLILSLQAPPIFRRRHDQLKNHEPRRVLRQRTFHAHRAMANRRKGAFNRIRNRYENDRCQCLAVLYVSTAYGVTIRD